MTDFLLELLSEEIPARMQAKASADLARLFAEEIAKSELTAASIEHYATPRRLALIARGLPVQTEAVREELKGPRAAAPPQALEGFLRKTGLTRDQLTERDGTFFAVVEKPGRATTAVIAEAVPAIVRALPWPKSMRWGEASISTESPRWVRPLQGVVALFGEEIVDFEIAGIRSGAATVGHRFHHPGPITIGSADDYADKLRMCHVILDPPERRAIIANGARAAAAAAGLALVEDDGLLAENAGLTEWPVPLLGEFDPAFLDVPPEVIQLTMRTNQKYFALTIPPRDGEGDHAQHGGVGRPHAPSPPSVALRAPPPRSGEDQLAPNFICTANIDAHDGGAGVVAGNRKVLAARLADAKFFWEQDLKVPLEEQAKKLDQIVFHEKLGTVADKVERVAKLARWLVEEGIVSSSPERGGGPAKPVEGRPGALAPSLPLHHAAHGPPPRSGEELAELAETAARLCKADLVTAMVGEFPELQGIMGGHYARAQGLDPQVADAIRDHYKPIGQGDKVPTAPVTVAVSLADKLDTLVSFASIGEKPTGSRDPFALRRAAIAIIGIAEDNDLRFGLSEAISMIHKSLAVSLSSRLRPFEQHFDGERLRFRPSTPDRASLTDLWFLSDAKPTIDSQGSVPSVEEQLHSVILRELIVPQEDVVDFLIDRLKVQQREAGVRHDLIDAVFALGGEDDLVRLLARVKALQAFVGTEDGANLLGGYKRAANILKKEGYSPSPRGGEGDSRSERGEGALSPSEPFDHEPPHPTLSPKGEGSEKSLSYTPLPEEQSLITALDSAERDAAAAVAAEDFEGAMTALASLRTPIDAFFDTVTVNDPDPQRRSARLALLARVRDAVHQVADFSRIEG